MTKKLQLQYVENPALWCCPGHFSGLRANQQMHHGTSWALNGVLLQPGALERNVIWVHLVCMLVSQRTSVKDSSQALGKGSRSISFYPTSGYSSCTSSTIFTTTKKDSHGISSHFWKLRSFPTFCSKLGWKVSNYSTVPVGQGAQSHPAFGTRMNSLEWHFAGPKVFQWSKNLLLS